jgi:Ni/Fe-hydrogenase subunit HybB-like protein
VRGAYVIAAYSAVLALHLGASLLGLERPQQWLAVAGLPLAAMTAIYTGYLFAQATARDLWQDALLVPHLLVQATLVGAGALLPLAHALDAPTAVLEWLLAGAALAHLVIVAGEATIAHVTAHARLAAHELTRGRQARFFWSGAALAVVALAAPWIGLAAAPFALLSVLAHEHAYVQAGQEVPLA